MAEFTTGCEGKQQPTLYQQTASSNRHFTLEGIVTLLKFQARVLPAQFSLSWITKKKSPDAGLIKWGSYVC